MHDDDETPLPEVDVERPQLARVWNYVLGGKDNFWADRKVGDEMIKRLPALQASAVANQRFRLRAVRYLATHGVQQFLDIGAGLPVGRGLRVHEIAQDIDPSARVVYVDNDPMVAAHGRVLLVAGSTAAGRAGFVEADVRSPKDLLDDPGLVEVLDLDEPVAVLATVVLACFDDDTAGEIVSTLLGALPVGSYLALSHPTGDFTPDAVYHAVAAADGGGLAFQPRTRDRVRDLFAGLELVEPGVVPVRDWRPDVHGKQAGPHGGDFWAGVARKPDAL